MQKIREQIQHESILISRIQTRFRTPSLDTLFVTIGRLFSHQTYVTVIPILFWTSSNSYSSHELHSYARAFVFMVCIGVYASGVAKDWFRLPRPSSPAIRIAELAWTNVEYGFPSTHSLHSLSLALLTAAYVVSIAPRYFVAAYSSALFVSAVVGFSRIYTGMHAFVDVVGGYALGLGLYLSFTSQLQSLIEHQLINADAISFISSVILVAWVLMRLHPDPGACPCINDSVASLGAYSGVLIGGWLRAHYPVVLSGTLISVYIARLCVGSGVLLLWRVVCKRVAAGVFKRYYFGERCSDL